MSVDRRAILTAALAAIVAERAGAQTPPPAVAGAALASDPTETIDLWPKGAPGGPAAALVETVDERSTDPSYADRAVYGISRPRLAVFRANKPSSGAVLIMPGGGYKWVVVDKEGYELGAWLAARGITAFVLFYRLPAEGWVAGPDVALQDAQRAMRIIRRRARDFEIDPDRVAAMGFSAGGHLCADLAARFAARVYERTDKADSFSARPFLAAPIYPVVAMQPGVAHAGSRERLIGMNPSSETEREHSPHLNIPKDAPPHFIVHAEDDASVPVENALLLRDALRVKGVPVEAHLFAAGGHGFGIRKAVGKPAEIWPQLFLNWARSLGL